MGLLGFFCLVGFSKPWLYWCLLLAAGAVYGYTNVVITWSVMFPTAQDISHIPMGQRGECLSDIWNIAGPMGQRRESLSDIWSITGPIIRSDSQMPW